MKVLLSDQIGHNVHVVHWRQYIYRNTGTVAIYQSQKVSGREMGVKSYLFAFAQRATAAFFALALRCFLVILAARALPPLSPPIRPKATAWGFFSGSGSGFVSPVASRTIS